MNRQNFLYVAGLAAALLLGQWLGGASSPALLPGATAAWADGATFVPDGETFVSADEGNAYLWRRDGDRIVLLNHCQRLPEASPGQATYVSLPGVERGS